MIRPIRSADAPDLWEVRIQPTVVWGTLQLPTLPKETVQAQCAPQDGHYSFVAEVDGRAVGQCGLHLSRSLRARHVAGLGITIHDGYQNQGLGGRLMTAVLDLADNYLGLERVELDVYTDNLRAIHLYERLGFEREGVYRADTFRDGAFTDVMPMARLRGRAAAAPRTPTAPGSQPPTAARGPRPDDLTIRPVRPEDVADLHRIYLQPGVLAHLDRTPALHMEEIWKEVASLSWGKAYVVAETGGRLVGAACLTAALPVRRRHVGTIDTIAVDEGWQGRGIGTALLEHLTNLADRWLNLKRLELRVPADAAPAINLAQRLGFETEAVLRSAFCRGGRLVDLVALGRLREARP